MYTTQAYNITCIFKTSPVNFVKPLSHNINHFQSSIQVGIMILFIF